MKHLFIGDPWEKIKPASDSSLALVRECLARQQAVYWASANALHLQKERLWIRAVPCLKAGLDALPDCGPEQELKIGDFNVVWIRKDPPFDTSYVSLCWLLALEEKRTLMVNRPSLLLRYHEKLLPFEALNAGFLKPADLVPTHMGDPSTAAAFLEQGKWEKAIRKPFLGFGGADVTLFDPKQSKPSVLKDEWELTQPFLNEVSKVGDRRVFYLNGKVVGDFVRLPQKGGFVSNLARGGSGHLVPMNAAQKKVAETLGRFLKKVGIVFAGADMIGKRISEVNITSPTGLLAFKSLSGKDLAVRIIDYVERAAL